MRTRNLIIFFIILMFIIIFSPKALAYTEWNSLDYNVEILSNGDMKVVETWNVVSIPAVGA